jgi:hypothetical protein
MAREVQERLKKVHMGAGRTHSEMEELRIAQVSGDIEKIKPNRVDKINDEHFKKAFSRYRIPEHEVNNYHVAMEARLFNTQTGAKISHPKVQVFDPATFARLLKTNGFHGYTTFILHDPTIKNSDVDDLDDETASLVDDKTGKVRGTGENESGTPFGGRGDVDPNDVNDTNTSDIVDTNNMNPNDPANVDLDSLNESDLKSLYMDLTGKSADGRWSSEKLKEKIAEIRGDVK